MFSFALNRHVRICERLGVKFPGPTRNTRIPRQSSQVSFVRLRTFEHLVSIIAIPGSKLTGVWVGIAPPFELAPAAIVDSVATSRLA